MEEIIFLLLISYVKTQEPPPAGYRLPPKPDRCNRPTEFMYRQCCLFPPFFTRDVAKACGSTMTITSGDKKYNYTMYLRMAFTECDHWKCILEKYGLLKPGDLLDDEKYYEHLDRWVQLNQDFGTVMSNGKTFCRNVYRADLPLPVCSFFNIHMCIRNYIVADCPVTIPTQECKEFKEFYDECREFYI